MFSENILIAYHLHRLLCQSIGPLSGTIDPNIRSSPTRGWAILGSVLIHLVLIISVSRYLSPGISLSIFNWYFLIYSFRFAMSFCLTDVSRLGRAALLYQLNTHLFELSLCFHFTCSFSSFVLKSWCVFLLKKKKKSSYLIARNLSRIHLLFNISVESFSLKIKIIIITIIIMIIMIKLIQVLFAIFLWKVFRVFFTTVVLRCIKQIMLWKK